MRHIEAVCFDLDDTLISAYAQPELAWLAIAGIGGSLGLLTAVLFLGNVAQALTASAAGAVPKPRPRPWLRRR